MSASSSEGFLPPRGSTARSSSTRWKSVRTWLARSASFSLVYGRMGSGLATRWTIFFKDSLSSAVVTWQKRSFWLSTWRSSNWASAATNQATGASFQKGGSLMFCCITRGGGGGGG